MANPTPKASLVIPEVGPDLDFVQLKDSLGNVVGWIDSSGTPQGNIAVVAPPPVSLPSSIDGGTF